MHSRCSRRRGVCGAGSRKLEDVLAAFRDANGAAPYHADVRMLREARRSVRRFALVHLATSCFPRLHGFPRQWLIRVPPITGSSPSTCMAPALPARSPIATARRAMRGDRHLGLLHQLERGGFQHFPSPPRGAPAAGMAGASHRLSRPYCESAARRKAKMRLPRQMEMALTFCVGDTGRAIFPAEPDNELRF